MLDKTEISKFTHRFFCHPGIPFVLGFSIIGFIVVVINFSITRGFIFVIVSGIFWIPVIITAWTDRNIQ